MFVYPCEQGVLGVRAKIFLLPETSEAIVRKSVPRTLLEVSSIVGLCYIGHFG